MNIAELMDILKDLDPDMSVEMAIVAPVAANSEEITVDQYPVEGVLPRDPTDHDGALVVWLIGGEPEDVDEFIDAVEDQTDAIQTTRQGELIDLQTAAARRNPSRS
jgi:hypothetical protein